MIRLRIMTTDPLAFFPLHKSDIANTRALLALGYPALGPHLKQLLEWLQDGNGPISRPIGEFLLTVPEAIAPLIQEVLAGEDHQWKYWCIVRLIGEMNPKVAEPFRFELLRLAECPTLAEAQSDLDQVSKDALQELWPADYHFSSPPLSNNRQEEKLDSQQNPSVLLAFVRREEDGQNKIYLYGTPDGLRKLASALVKQSESNQDHLADYDTDHTHYRATHQNAILAPSSDEVVLGRLDLRNGELASWAQHELARPGVVHRISRIQNAMANVGKSRFRATGNCDLVPMSPGLLFRKVGHRQETGDSPRAVGQETGDSPRAVGQSPRGGVRARWGESTTRIDKWLRQLPSKLWIAGVE
jgi:hypothetical protein